MSPASRLLVALLLVLFGAGCTASGMTSDKDPHHGFYGGISAGAAIP